MVPRKVRGQIGQDAFETLLIQMALHLVERQISEAVTIQDGVEDQIDGVEDERAVDTRPNFPRATFQSPPVDRSRGGQPQIDGAMFGQL